MSYNNKIRRPSPLLLSVIPITLALAGCFSGSSASSSSPAPGPTPAPSSQVLTGTFIDSAVSGLEYRGSTNSGGLTDELGQFQYEEGEILTFFIGELELGSAQGAEVLTPLTITEGAASAQDPRVSNMLVLLQTLDADGDLNNGIQLTEEIREEVSRGADDIQLDQSPTAFRTAIQPIVASLHEAGVFTDADPRPRAIVSVTAALEHFERSARQAKGSSSRRGLGSFAALRPTPTPGSSSASPTRSRPWASCAGSPRSPSSRGKGFAMPSPGATRRRRTPRFSVSAKVG